MLAKRFARGGIRTRDLQHGAVGASYHYTTRSHSNFGRSRSARDQNRNSEKAERCGIARSIVCDKDHENRLTESKVMEDVRKGNGRTDTETLRFFVEQ